ncbi:MAG: radical SAM protein [Clostridiaceae bacterium]|jgi:radical SAM protein with 4Fe4S-binding SPASM domain|nr:radical SAM protein [Clostridiaceae bacterium]
MKDNFFVYNGWLGMEMNGTIYLYNVTQKEVAVFSSQAGFEATATERLKKIDVKPEPDFTFSPSFSAITLTTKCNMECPYCYVKPIKGVGVMTVERTQAAVRALAEQTDNELVIYAWGGEPTQNPNALLAMLREAQKFPHVKILLISNGVMNNSLLQELLSFKNLVFQISFDGLNNENHQKPLVSKDDSLAGMLSSMDTISQISKRVSLRATVTRRNVEELKDCLIQTAKKFTNRVLIEHLHTFNGRAIALRHEAPAVDDFVNLIFDIIPSAEKQGVHVKALPLDHLRAGGPNDKMNFFNILTDGKVTVSNAVIHSSHQDFPELHIGNLVDGHIVFDKERNDLLSKRYLDNYKEQCQDCFAKTVCRGSVQRYLFITNDSLFEWDDLRCQYFKGILARWMEETINAVSKFMKESGVNEGFVQLMPPKDKIHYPMFIMKEGLSLSYKPFV